MSNIKKKKLAIVGARGYTGLEVARLLLAHPHFEITHLTSSDSQWRLQDDLPGAQLGLSETIQYEDTQSFLANAPQLDLDGIVLAMSAQESHQRYQELESNAIPVVDLSGAFRLSPSDCQKHYGIQAKMDSQHEVTHYGLVPWQQQLDTKLVSNPGCYPTATLMALLPLLKEGLLNLEETIVVDAKSGTTGAGKSPQASTQLSELGEGVLPYKTHGHQHGPEIERYSQHFSGQQAKIEFTTTLLPIRRGILASIYASLNPAVGTSEIESAFKGAYKNYPLVEFGELSKKDPFFMSLGRLNKSPITRIGYSVREERVVVYSMIDNLMKGAASQAIENLNLLFDLPVHTGLLADGKNL